MFTLCFTVILITIFTTMLYSENQPQLQLEGIELTLDAPTIGTIFYKDLANKLVLIDFKEVRERLSTVQLTQADKVLLEDKVSDLAIDSIYELDLNTYDKGNYTITLITLEKRAISEQITIE
ncbi:MAG: hypothetical protein AAGJ18_23230 [Bacteroidota bacterium]